jgi:hypothetical protein
MTARRTISAPREQRPTTLKADVIPASEAFHESS